MAQQEVLTALQAAPQLSQQQADELGAASITRVGHSRRSVVGRDVK